MMDANTASFKVVMFPFLAHGHISPFLELSKKLSSKNFQIYFCSTSINLQFIENSLDKDSSYKNKPHVPIELVELHLPSLPQLTPQYHTTKNIPPHLAPLLMQAFQGSSSSLSSLLSNLRPDLLVYDLFQPWSVKIAASEGIPAVHFFTGGSASGSFMHHWHSHKGFDDFPFEEIFLREHEKRALIATSKIVKVKEGDQEEFANGIFNISCDIVLIKSCRGIEGKYMDYLSSLCGRKMVPTGPLITRGEEKETAGAETIMEWLGEREIGSTLYISFGSENFFSQKQMVEMAKGLEMVDVSFIWVARPPGKDAAEAPLPEGFLERVGGRGLVVRMWAPQAAILAHPSVGAFMSHCGWSSVTESLYYGVPVVALPLKIDQPVNARLLVAAGAGVEVERDEDGTFDGEAVAKAVHEAMVEGKEGLRRGSRAMSEKMKMEEDENIDTVVGELSRICSKK